MKTIPGFLLICAVAVGPSDATAVAAPAKDTPGKRVLRVAFVEQSSPFTLKEGEPCDLIAVAPGVVRVALTALESFKNAAAIPPKMWPW